MQDFVISKKGKSDAIERTIYTVPAGRICVLVDWFVNNTTSDEIQNCSVVIGEQSCLPGTVMAINTKYFESNRHIELLEGDSIVVKGKDLTYFFSGIEQDAYPDSTPASYPSINQSDLEAFRSQYSALETKILELFNNGASDDSFTPNNTMTNIGSEEKPWEKTYTKEVNTNTIIVGGKDISEDLKRMDKKFSTLDNSFLCDYPSDERLMVENDNLNTFVAPGTYLCPTYAICETIVNKPEVVTTPFRLIAINNSNSEQRHGTQLLITGNSYSSTFIWYRSFGYSSTDGIKFDTWRRVADNDNLSTPSSKFVDFSTGYTSTGVSTIGYTDDVYTAPADGYIVCKAKSDALDSGTISYFGVGRNGVCWNGTQNTISGNHIFVFIPVSKGDSISYLGARIASMVFERFYYAKSAK